MTENRLELAHQKTEAIIVCGARNKAGITFKIGDSDISPKKVVKYLGVWIGENGSFAEHVQNTVAKAERSVAALTRVLPNIGGPSAEKRRVMCEVGQSVMLYGASVWHQVMNVDKYKKTMISLQRRLLLRVVSAYKTVSAEAVQLVAGVPPIDLLVYERNEAYSDNEGTAAEKRKRAREKTVEKWQYQWNNGRATAGWTRELIPNIGPWLGCKHRQIEYYITQVLTGHGCFKAYTHRIGKTINESCDHCDAEVDNAKHTLFSCPRWQPQRNACNDVLGVRLDTHKTS